MPVVKDEVSYDDLEQLSIYLNDKVEKKVKKTASKTHYVKNSELYPEYIKYHATKMAAIERGDPIPPLTNNICKAVIAITNKLCYSASYINYSSNWKEEMVGDAIEICVRYAHNFDPSKSNNPFSYLTQFVGNAFIQRIAKEKRQLYYKYKMFDQAGGFDAITDQNVSDMDIVVKDEMSDMYRDHLEFIDRYEDSAKATKLKNKAETIIEPQGIEKFM